jgi:hypothetical protein
MTKHQLNSEVIEISESTDSHKLVAYLRASTISQPITLDDRDKEPIEIQLAVELRRRAAAIQDAADKLVGELTRRVQGRLDPKTTAVVLVSRADGRPLKLTRLDTDRERCRGMAASVNRGRLRNLPVKLQVLDVMKGAQ